MLDEAFTEEVIGAAIEVHRTLGAGLLESVYQRSLEVEFEIRGIAMQPQSRLPLSYKGHHLGSDLVMDFFMPGRLVLEIKSVIELAPIHSAQLLSYMKLCDVPLGLLINFNVPLLKQGIIRLIL